MDGGLIATAGLDGKVVLWHGSTGRRLHTFDGYSGSISDMQFSRDGSTLATASADGSVKVWKVGSRQLLWEQDSGSHIRDLSYSPDGSKLAKVWDADTGGLIAALDGHRAGVTFAGFSPDGDRLVTTSRDGTVRLWDARSGAPLWTHTGHEDGVWSARFDAAGDRVLSIGLDGTARLWLARKTLHQSALVHEHTVHAVDITADGERIATLDSRGTVRIWNHEGALHSSFDIGPSRMGLALHPDGDRLATCAGLLGLAASKEERRGGLAQVDIWDTSTGARLFALTGHADLVLGVEYDPRGDQIVTAAGDDTARIWDAETGALVRTLCGHQDMVMLHSTPTAAESCLPATTRPLGSGARRQGRSRRY